MTKKLGRIIPPEEFRTRTGGISKMQEWRLAQSGEGPPRVRIGGGKHRVRWGYPEIPYEKWLESRLEKPLPQTEETAQ